MSTQILIRIEKDMFGRSEVKGNHPGNTIISKKRGEMQTQQLDEHYFFKCPICSFRTPLRGDLQKHISMYHKQVFVCKICTSKFSSREDLVEHKRLSHLNIPLKSEQGRVYSCQKCGSKFANAKIFTVHVKITCLKGDFVGQSGKRNKYRLYNPANMVQKTTNSKINQIIKDEEKIRDSLPFHQLPKSQGFFDTYEKRKTMLSAFFGQQALNLELTKPIKTENKFGDIEDKYSNCSGCGFLVLQDHHSCKYKPNQNIFHP